MTEYQMYPQKAVQEENFCSSWDFIYLDDSNHGTVDVMSSDQRLRTCEIAQRLKPGSIVFHVFINVVLIK